MINLMLDNLCRPAGKGFDTGLELFVLPPNFDGLVTLAGARTTEQGKTAFLGIIWSGHLDNFQVEHCHICAIVK